MKLLVSGGPTHEYLDDVRFLGNPSTGALGIAIAAAARDAGHEVTLVLGPTHLPDPPHVRVVRVVSALDMLAAIQGQMKEADALIMTAAVADYRPKRRVVGKIKKSGNELSLPLVKNPDILATCGKMPHHVVLVGFALEAADDAASLDFAQKKLAAKNLDLIVLNRSGSFAGPTMESVKVLYRGGDVRDLGAPSKAELALWLVSACETLVKNRHGNAGPQPRS
jgi:phosphopantothenoylcysteine decarboxylase/phosphopantothenate--cysteine ligase